MNDRELLELAAKAAGSDVFMLGDTWVQHIGEKVEGINRWVGSWNPLTDDGDALRLAVKLSINVAPGTATNRFSVAHGCSQVLEERKPDKYAATRRAITRAAAEIGKAMP